MKFPESPAARAWTALGVGIIAYEIGCPIGQTLSEGVDRALETHPFLTTTAIGTVALHLVNAFEAVGLEDYDPIHAAVQLFKEVT